MIVVLSVVVFTHIGWLYGCISAFVLLTISSEALLPTRYQLGPDGVEAFNLFRHARRPWARFAGWRETGGGFHLKGDGPIDFLARRRSLYLSHPDDCAAVEALLHEHLGRVDEHI